MRACASCGHENADDVDFCANCGQYIRWEPTRLAPKVEAPAQPAPSAPPPAAPAAAAPAAPAQPGAAPPPPAPAAQAPPPPPPPPPAPVTAPPPAPPPPPPPAPGSAAAPAAPAGPAVGAQLQQHVPRTVPTTPPRAPRVPKSPGEVGGLLGRFKRGGGKKEAATPEQQLAAAGAAQPPGQMAYQTWAWPAAETEEEHKSPVGKIIFFVVLLLLLIAAALAAAWYFVLREDEEKPKPKAAATTVAKGGGVDAQLRALVFELDPLLRSSARDRAKIKRAIIGVERNCRVQPDQAAATVSEVTTNRQAVLKKVRTLKPPTAASKRLVAQLNKALTLSIAANGGYSKWLGDLGGSAAACRNPTANANYQAAQGINAQTQTAKKAFVVSYNPLAKRFGKRTWTSLEI